MTLDEIGVQTGTDQSSLFHDYCRTMDELLSPRRHERVVLMEQGILAGQGLRMWSEYFTHPDTVIIGVDPHTYDRPPIEDPRVHVVVGSQIDAFLMNDLVDKYGSCDWITDDASHFASAQIQAFQIAWPLIKPGGFWCCQDLHSHAAPELCDAPENIMQFLTRIATEMQGKGAKASGRVELDSPWATIDTITFRRGMCVIRKAK